MTAPPRDLVVVDAGNTRIKFARFESREAGQLPRLCELHAVLCGDPIDWSALRDWPFLSRSVQGFVSGSNPSEMERVRREWPEDWPSPTLIRDRSVLSIPLLVDYPDRVGMDRVLNGVAARVLLADDQAAIVVDSGTTVTVDAVSGEGFLGGAILPGFELSAKALNQYTALLPLIEHHRLYETLPPAIGRHTEAALDSGLFWGHVGAVREVVDRIAGELRTGKHSVCPLLLLTGGAARLLMPYLPGARYEPMLALQGLAYFGLHRESR